MNSGTFKSFILITIIFFMVGCRKDKALNQINTVQGSIKPEALGMSLSHEHIMSNFGKDISETSVYDSIKLFNQVVPYLKKMKSLGVNSIFDCTAEYFGRRVDLLKMISDSTDVQIITNTGIYGAANDRYIPEFAYQASVESISEVWINEFENGIRDTGIKPGFIKLAFDDTKAPSDIDRKLFEAGLLTHLNTGLTLAVHTGKNIEAVKLQETLLNKYNVDLSAWVWTHANKVDDDQILIDYANKGAWISLDGVRESNTTKYIERIKLFKQKNLLHKILLSHDGNGFPKGGKIRKFEAIFQNLIPDMLKNGFSEKEINQILISNPKEALKIRVRKA
ncbi:phosphotriesterase family protein [Flavivirga rizhaonensis]|uniref:Phosphotriesterase n=1 Tax=Flavivirga rizhaonensis TaxID=2559571 RepID=A0A4S1DS26_9FLAO|nr:phosphotriesterase [Flavivirga rizhaonensis]TGV00741.1 phosphotriesterase [Flavivirga rizhaonensis]